MNGIFINIVFCKFYKFYEFCLSIYYLLFAFYAITFKALIKVEYSSNLK